MYKIKLMNKIAESGLELFDNNYECSEDFDNEDAILVRSASLHDYDFHSNLKAIARAGAGVNNIPLEECASKGIVVFNTPGANANAVKELVLAGLFMSSRKIVEAINWAASMQGDADVAKKAEKVKSQYAGPEIAGKSIGVIGLGAIGVKVANACAELGMKVYGFDPFISIQGAWALNTQVINTTNLDEIFKNCDYISLHVPSTKDTKGFINAEAFEKMKDEVRILNFARGDLVNNEAILEAIKSKKVAKYVTDFAEPELLGVEDIIVLPHLGASTPESEENCAKMAVKEVRDFLENGNITNSVNFPRCVQERESKVRLCIINKNVPNILARISKLFADHDLNIENMVNRAKGEYAYTLIDTNSEVREDIVERINAVEEIISLRVIK